MVSRPGWTPDHVSIDTPSVARMYDYYLGGYHNFAADRAAAEAAIAVRPELPLVMQANRAFLRRAVRFMIEQGIEQFLDIGSGIPTVGNVHEVAQQANPAARVVYVDIDPVAVAHSQAILRGNALATVIQADARQPEQIIRHPETQRLLDWNKPVAVLLVALLHFVPDDADAAALVRVFRDASPTGSYLAISHASHAHLPAEVSNQVRRVYNTTTNAITPRTRDLISRCFDGLELVEPGLVFAPLWRPESPDDLFLDTPERSSSYVGVGRKART